MGRLLTICVLVCSVVVCGQTVEKSAVRKAHKEFNYGNYIDAVLPLKRMVASNPDNALYKYELAVCYLNTSSFSKAKMGGGVNS